jgi:hypothetical protein
LKVIFTEIGSVFIISLCKTIWVLSRGNSSGNLISGSEQAQPAMSICSGAENVDLVGPILGAHAMQKQRLY